VPEWGVYGERVEGEGEVLEWKGEREGMNGIVKKKREKVNDGKRVDFDGGRKRRKKKIEREVGQSE